MKHIGCLFTFLFFLASSGCVPPSETQSGKPLVLVSIDPQKYFVEKIAGDRVDVEVLVPTGKEPETYTPTPNQLKRIAQCQVFFRIGFPIEETFLPKLRSVAPSLKIVDTRKGITLRIMESHNHGSGSEHADAHDSDHGHGHEHNHDAAIGHDRESGADPHIWFAPQMVRIQSKTIAETLSELDPQGKETYDKNQVAFEEELTQAHNTIAGLLAKCQGETIYVFHPAYGYFCDEFGLKQRAIELEGQSPKAKELAQWIEQARADKVRMIFVQPEFNPASAEKIAKEIDAKVIVHSPLGKQYSADLIEFAKMITGQNSEKEGSASENHRQ